MGKVHRRDYVLALGGLVVTLGVAGPKSYALGSQATEAEVRFWDPSKVYVLEDGDGHPEFMHRSHHLRYVEESWFPNEVRGMYAVLFRVVDSEFDGVYVALSSRLRVSIEDQIKQSGLASVVVNIVNNPTSTFGQNEDADSQAVGMTILKIAAPA